MHYQWFRSAHGDKTFFLHLRDNVGCQLLKRTVKTGAALVENAGGINNESQTGGGTKESQLQGETILVDGTAAFPIPANVRTSQTGQEMDTKKQGQETNQNRGVIQMSPSHMGSELRVVMVTFAACQWLRAWLMAHADGL